jgi:iron complex transport system permease protein
MRHYYWLLLLLLFLPLFFLSLAIGSVYLPLSDVWAALAGAEVSELSRNIVLNLRLPRAIAAALGSASLALAGLLMQTLFRNPLAGPSVLGLSSGASLAVALVVLGGMGTSLGYYATTLAAIAGSTAVLLVILAVARRFTDVTTVLIVGLMLSFFTSAVVGLLQSMADESALKAFVFWGFGSFASVSLPQMGLFATPLLVGIAGAVLLIKPLNALLLGEMHARTMGIHIHRMRIWIMLITGVLTGVVTAFCGPIAFIGLAAPHLARMLSASVHHAVVLPATLLTGACLGLFCDLVARWPFGPQSIPLNTVCAFMGAPVVIYLIFAARRKKWLI